MTIRRLNRATRQQLNRGWYRIENKAGDGDKPATIHLYDEIGFWGTPAADFIKELADISASAIDLRVNSPGGEIFDGFAIYNALADHPASITARVDGLAASAASFIAQAADKIIVKETSQMMIHDGIGFAFGNASDMRSLADQLDKLSGMIANIYANRSGIDASLWRDLMLAETWFDAHESVAAGLADEVELMPERGRRDNKAPAPADTWDLSPFRFPGRAAAPAPSVASPGRVPAPEPTTQASLFDWLESDPASPILDDDILTALRGGN